MAAFPREIVDLIVGHLPCNEGPLLFVSPIFRASARAAIFRHITITFSLSRDNPRIGLLIQVIQGDPTVLEGTRQLAIHIDKFPPRIQPSEGGDVVITDNYFETLLPLLLNAPILKLEVKGAYRGYRRTGVSMSQFSTTEVEGLIALRSLPSLVEVSILALSGCSSLLLTHPNYQTTTLAFFGRRDRGMSTLRPLQLDERVFDRGTAECGILYGLRTLRIGNPYQFLHLVWTSLHERVPKPSIRIPGLTTLSVSELSASGLDALAAIVASCPVLETLVLRYQGFYCPTTNLEGLRKASRFSELHVDFGSHLNRGHIAHHLRNIVGFLKGYSPIPYVQKVVASVDWEESRMVPHTLVILRDGFLPELRDALSSLPPSLLFVLRISFVSHCAEDMGTLDKSRTALREVLDGFATTNDAKLEYEFLS